MNPRIQRITVAHLTARAFNTTVEVLLRGSRSKPHCKARFAIWTLVKEFRPDTSLPELGRMLGGKDHTTVMYGLRKAEHLLAYDEDFRAKVEEARRLVAQCRPEDRVRPEPIVSLVPVAPRWKTPPVVVSEAPKLTSQFGDYETWLRQTCEGSEARFLDIASREFPHLVRVPQKEAAE